MYKRFVASGMDAASFLENEPAYHEQSQQKRLSVEQMRLGQVALDCRYLNAAPQCKGWHDLTEHGGSGSFVIKWSGLWKLTTAAAVPYYTGQYGSTKAGFGWVTIGANVEEFHKSATETKAQIDALIQVRDQSLQQQLQELRHNVAKELQEMTWQLAVSTAIMTAVVVAIAIWMASVLTSRITTFVTGLRRFQEGNYDQRLQPKSQDELGQTAAAFNAMADTVRESLVHLLKARDDLERQVEMRTNELQEANAALTRQAITDELTGAYNRRYFTEFGRREIARCQRQGRPLTLIIFDVDHFKTVNDTHGHVIGDKTLQQVAAICRDNIREYDCFARIGGEEFVILQPDTDLQGACEIADRIRCAVEREPIATEQGPITVTLSAGVAQAASPSPSLDALLATADAALYRAKAAGRNCVLA